MLFLKTMRTFTESRVSFSCGFLWNLEVISKHPPMSGSAVFQAGDQTSEINTIQPELGLVSSIITAN